MSIYEAHHHPYMVGWTRINRSSDTEVFTAASGPNKGQQYHVWQFSRKQTAAWRLKTGLVALMISIIGAVVVIFSKKLRESLKRSFTAAYSGIEIKEVNIKSEEKKAEEEKARAAALISSCFSGPPPAAPSRPLPHPSAPPAKVTSPPAATTAAVTSAAAPVLGAPVSISAPVSPPVGAAESKMAAAERKVRAEQEQFVLDVATPHMCDLATEARIKEVMDLYEVDPKGSLTAKANGEKLRITNRELTEVLILAYELGVGASRRISPVRVTVKGIGQENNFKIYIGESLGRRSIEIYNNDMGFGLALGNGSVADVMRFFSFIDAQPIAIKEIKQRLVNYGRNEQRLLMELHGESPIKGVLSPPIILLLQSVDRPEREPCLRYPLIRGHELHKVIFNGEGGYLSPKACLTIAGRMLDILMKVHKRGFAHNQLVSNNWVVDLSSRDGPEVTLVGFSRARRQTDRSTDLETIWDEIKRMLQVKVKDIAEEFSALKSKPLVVLRAWVEVKLKDL